MQARFYAPWYGRFLSPDPARDQHFEETQSWNIYSYVQNNPTMKIDPTGMLTDDPSFGMQVSQTMLGYLEGLATSLPFVGDRISASLPQDVPEHQMIAREQIGKPVGEVTQLVTGAAELKAAATGLKGIQVAQMVTSTGQVVTVVSGGAKVATQAATGGALVASAMAAHGGGKNAQHTNQDAKASAKSQYEQAKAEHDTAKAKTNKTPADKKAQEEAKRKMDHLKRKMDETGENHSRRDKR